MSEFVGTGVVKDGALRVRHRGEFEAAMRQFPDCEVMVTVQRLYATRSVEQNALYWIGYVRPLAGYAGNPDKEMHEYLKSRFLPPHKVQKKTIAICDANGVIVDEFTYDASTTTTLNKIEFGDYLRDIDVFASGLGVRVGRREDVA